MSHHKIAGEETEDYAAISIDYGFLNESASETESIPILCVKDSMHRWVAGHIVPKKGVDEFAVEVLTNELVQSGHARIHLRSDQEPAILALKEAAAARARLKGIEVVMEEPALHDSRGNGAAESAVKEIKDQTRTLLASTASKYGMELKGDHFLVPWLVRYAGQVINRCRRGADGKTAYELRKGRSFKREIPPFAERIMYMLALAGTTARVDPRWAEGVYVGLSDRTDEALIATADGIVKARTVRRREKDRYDKEVLRT
eukprot:2116603-Amphidinium_carterae.1